MKKCFLMLFICLLLRFFMSLWNSLFCSFFGKKLFWQCPDFFTKVDIFGSIRIMSKYCNITKNFKLQFYTGLQVFRYFLLLSYIFPFTKFAFDRVLDTWKLAGMLNVLKNDYFWICHNKLNTENFSCFFFKKDIQKSLK